MKLLRSEDDGYVFQLGRREKDLLLSTLKLYPRIPPGHLKLSRTSEPEPSNQALLEESLAEQRAENQRKLLQWLANPARWLHADHGWRLSLTEAELEWLLQVLNDIRVGSWVLLGSPEDKVEAVTDDTAPYLWSMEVAGAFQIGFLQAFESKA